MKVALTFLAMISCTVIANVLMKMGATGMEPSSAGFIARLLSWRVILGISFLGGAAMIYLVILSWIPLSVAQSFAAAQFVAVIVASAIVLNESIGTLQLVGMTLIAIGIVIVGLGR